MERNKKIYCLLAIFGIMSIHATSTPGDEFAGWEGLLSCTTRTPESTRAGSGPTYSDGLSDCSRDSEPSVEVEGSPRLDTPREQVKEGIWSLLSSVGSGLEICGEYLGWLMETKETSNPGTSVEIEKTDPLSVSDKTASTYLEYWLARFSLYGQSAAGESPRVDSWRDNLKGLKNLIDTETLPVTVLCLHVAFRFYLPFYAAPLANIVIGKLLQREHSAMEASVLEIPAVLLSAIGFSDFKIAAMASACYSAYADYYKVREQK